MLEKANEKDKVEEERIKKITDEFDQVSPFRKIWNYNSPKLLVIPLIIFSGMNGISQPLFAIIFSKILGILTLPFDLMELVYGQGYVKT